LLLVACGWLNQLEVQGSVRRVPPDLAEPRAFQCTSSVHDVVSAYTVK
jgi:hypothetical protein